MRKFSADGTVFKRQPRNLDDISQQERDEIFQRSMHNLLLARRDASERQNARRLERMIIQFKANQLPDNDGSRDQISILEAEDPALFEELSMRKKWSNVSKDPVKGLRDQQLNKNSYWNMLNHLPSKGVNRIVTDKILDLDKSSCDRILQGILEEKQLAEMKKSE